MLPDRLERTNVLYTHERHLDRRQLDLGAPADERTLGMLRAARGVLGAEPAADGVRVRLEGRSVLPGLVARLVQMEVPVYAAVPRPPSVEDIYFAVQDGDGETRP